MLGQETNTIMDNELSLKSEKELQEAILQDKAKGIPDLEIGKKYGVTFRYIERLITSSQGLNVSAFKETKRIKALHPKDFKEEQTTIWSFKQRGTWATHSGEYRGNWSPYIPRNVILKYSTVGDVVLDYFCGAGTTAVECKLLGRKCIALDINDKAIELAKKNVNFSTEQEQLTLLKDTLSLPTYEPLLLVGDARDLSFLQDNSIDLICAHPPYANIIHYTDSKDGDLSFLNIDDFLEEMAHVAKESFRVLKPGRKCAILIGDTRQKRYIVPLGFKLIQVFLDAGFKLRELVIKRQHNCKTTGFWYKNSIKYNFLLLAHEYLPIFEKPIVSHPVNVKEKQTDYGVIIPILDDSQVKTKIDKLETTTVWVLPDENFEECLNKNVIDRYSSQDGYLNISFTLNPKNGVQVTSKKIQGKKRLFFVKSPCLINNPSLSSIEQYINKLAEIVRDILYKASKDVFLVIQTQDVRIDGYIVPIAKRIVEILTYNNLWLKEIVIVTKESSNLKIQNLENYLEIVHQYLLVYEIKNG